MDKELELFLNVVKTKPWFLDKAVEVGGEEKLAKILLYGWLTEDFLGYTLEKTGKFYDPSLNPFDPTILSEYFDIPRF